MRLAAAARQAGNEGPGERLHRVPGTRFGGKRQSQASGRDPEVLPPVEFSHGIMPVLVERIACGDKQNEKRTLVVVEQDVPMPFRTTDRFVLVEQGRIVAASEARRAT